MLVKTGRKANTHGR